MLLPRRIVSPNWSKYFECEKHVSSSRICNVLENNISIKTRCCYCYYFGRTGSCTCTVPVGNVLVITSANLKECKVPNNVRKYNFLICWLNFVFVFSVSSATKNFVEEYELNISHLNNNIDVFFFFFDIQNVTSTSTFHTYWIIDVHLELLFDVAIWITRHLSSTMKTNLNWRQRQICISLLSRSLWAYSADMTKCFFFCLTLLHSFDGRYRNSIRSGSIIGCWTNTNLHNVAQMKF